MKFLFCKILFILFFVSFEVMAISDSYRIEPAQQSAINEQGVCKNVTNNNSLAIMVPTKTSSEWSNFIANASGCNITSCGAPCVGPDADYLESGESKTYYIGSTGSDCASYERVRTCTDGVLSNIGTANRCYLTIYFDCWHDDYHDTGDCVLGGLAYYRFNLGTSYLAASIYDDHDIIPGCGTGELTATSASCSDNGYAVSISRITGSIKFNSSGGITCDDPLPTTSCRGPDGTIIATGGSKTYYSAPCGASCTGQTRTCTNGTLSGTYLYPTCTGTCKWRFQDKVGSSTCSGTDTSSAAIKATTCSSLYGTTNITKCMPPAIDPYDTCTVEPFACSTHRYRCDQ